MDYSWIIFSLPDRKGFVEQGCPLDYVHETHSTYSLLKTWRISYDNLGSQSPPFWVSIFTTIKAFLKALQIVLHLWQGQSQRSSSIGPGKQNNNTIPLKMPSTADKFDHFLNGRLLHYSNYGKLTSPICNESQLGTKPPILLLLWWLLQKRQ